MIHARDDYNRIQDPENKIPDTEPVFLLRAQDMTAVPVLRYWIKLNKSLLREQKDGLDDTQIAARRKAIVLAEAHAFRMEDWPKQKPADC